MVHMAQKIVDFMAKMQRVTGKTHLTACFQGPKELPPPPSRTTLETKPFNIWAFGRHLSLKPQQLAHIVIDHALPGLASLIASLD